VAWVVDRVAAFGVSAAVAATATPLDSTIARAESPANPVRTVFI
jgi:hypothetical protein